MPSLISLGATMAAFLAGGAVAEAGLPRSSSAGSSVGGSWSAIGGSSWLGSSPSESLDSGRSSWSFMPRPKNPRLDEQSSELGTERLFRQNSKVSDMGLRHLYPKEPTKRLDAQSNDLGRKGLEQQQILAPVLWNSGKDAKAVYDHLKTDELENNHATFAQINSFLKHFSPHLKHEEAILLDHVGAYSHGAIYLEAENHKWQVQNGARMLVRALYPEKMQKAFFDDSIEQNLNWHSATPGSQKKNIDILQNRLRSIANDHQIPL